MIDDPPEPLELDALTRRWSDRWSDCRPIGHEVRGCARDRWVRFHSLPESKRYADTVDEYAEIMRRHLTVLNALLEAIGRRRGVVVIVAAWSQRAEPAPLDRELAETFPRAAYWCSILRDLDGTDEYWTHLYAGRSGLASDDLRGVLRLVADDVIADVIVSHDDLEWLYHPYDGGADVIASSVEQRNELRDRHSDWLSAHPRGL